ncbi:MAG TPA: hypothetical protein VFT81_04830 [Dermatophilaceae bacterium]|nr:hypothetical protein [Dermatophilaceae bacterium]
MMTALALLTPLLGMALLLSLQLLETHLFRDATGPARPAIATPLQGGPS